MIQPFLSHLAFHCSIVLASKSPRRKRVLEELRLVFEAVPSPVPQYFTLEDFSSPGDLVMQSAKEKALTVTEFIKAHDLPQYLPPKLLHFFRKICSSSKKELPTTGLGCMQSTLLLMDLFQTLLSGTIFSQYHADLVIGADTVVILEGEVFDLPINKADGHRMIQRLNGKTHEVFSGAALVLPRYENGVENHQIETFYEMAKVTFGSLPPDVIQAYFESGKPWANVGGYAIERLGGTLIESIEGNYYTVVGFPVHKFCKEIYRMCSEGLL